MTRAATVFVVDDDAAVRDGLDTPLAAYGYTVETFESAERFLDRPPPDAGGCIVADMRMPGMGGLELLRELARRGVTVPVIIITGHGDIPMTVAAFKAGAVDFLEKPFDGDALVGAIDEALKRRGAAMADLPARDALAARLRELSPREREVMDLVVAGLPNKVIAHRLGIAVRTVEVHRARLMEKSGARNLSERGRIAIRLEGPR
ncbi:MAG: response regulator transcription factor [Alphaproteobacteria bacterium]|nr:response regulator transcription factor [Alphaproteobacteria bacterium]